MDNFNNQQNNDMKPDDEYVIGNGFVITDTETTEVKNKKSIKKKGNARGVLRTVIWILSILIASATISVGAIFCVIDYMGLGSSNTVTVTIDEGESLDSIASELKESGVIRFKFLFKFYAGSKNYYEKFTAGAHTVRTDMGYSGIVNNFTTVEGYTIKTVKVTIPQTATIDSIAELLEEKEICPKIDFYDAVRNSTFNYSFLKDIPLKKVHYRLEGYLFPDTYEFYAWNSKEGAEFAINAMLQNFDTKFNEDYRKKATELGYSMHEITTMASIIELECNGYYDDMAKVSAVFYNRLTAWGDQPKMLGSSPTADYPYGHGNYDTNKIEGLPPGPLCAPSAESIKAALYPDEKMKNVYYYFVTDVDFNYYYTKTYDEHLALINSLRYKGKWGED